ncbi:YT521-B-like domain-containing protein [Neurospora hispaniola]|uniref:YT521-B-like domain-containing protein n=1 Tax=Neurospora hispaniola TaxID=588809 RepID=A0AAJ0MR35_9PEZI|nr:YT521-B-like domain-containing protein [Neurospora hispaniola]
MSSPVPPNMKKLAIAALDAKTRELKQRLQAIMQERSSFPPATSEHLAAASRPLSTTTVASTPRPPQVETPKPRFVPHTVPQVPTETSISADESDIAALIRSFSDHVDPTADIIPRPASSTTQQNQSSVEAQPVQATPAPVSNPSSVRPPKPAEAAITAISTSDEEGEIPSDTEEPVKAGMAHERSQEQSKHQVAQEPDKAPRSGPNSTSNKKQLPQKGPGKPQTGTGKALRTNNRPESQNAQTKNQPTATLLTPEKALERALELNPDLREWLALTNYHDAETRTKKIERYRKLKALAAEKERIEAEHAAQRARLEAEQRKLLEEEGLDFGLIATPVVETAPAIINKVSEVPEVVAPKREREPSVDMTDAPPEKKHRPEENGPRPMDIDNQYDDRYRERGRPEYPIKRAPSWSPRRYRAPSPRRDHRPSRPTSRDREYQHSRFSPRPRSRDRSEYNKYDGRLLHKHDDRSYRDDVNGFFDEHGGDKAQSAQSPRRPRDLEHVEHFDTGKKGDTRFFVLKSFNNENLDKAMDDAIWVTQTSNEEKFTKAYQTCKNVIFFFSVNKSKAFQGYALMTSLPSADINKASWMKNIHWQTSPPFRLRWLSKVAVPFSRIGYLKNPLNENLSVLIAKDGQEVEEDCGRALLREMESYAEWESNKTAFPSGSRQQPQPARRESDSASGFNPASWWKNKKKPHNNTSHWNNQRNTKRADDYHDRFPAR